eukprot:8438676-Prorocentrum_lima.AAC.1
MFQKFLIPVCEELVDQPDSGDGHFVSAQKLSQAGESVAVAVSQGSLKGHFRRCEVPLEAYLELDLADGE